jgi:DNA-binding transcriptional LysR family regulator
MDRLKALEIFAAVTRQGSFVKGAEAMDLSTSVTTRAVQELENLLGVRLLVRTTRRLALTPVGQSVLARADALLNDYAELASMSSLSACEPSGDIRFVVPASYGMRQLGPVLAEFMTRYPKIRLDLRVSEAGHTAPDPLDDLTLCIASELPPSAIARKLGDARVAMYASPKCLARMGLPLHPRSMRAGECLRHVDSSQAARWQLSHCRTEERHALPPAGVFVSNHTGALLSAAVHGAGVVLVPSRFVERQLASGELVPLLPEWEGPKLGVYLVYASRSKQPLCVRKLIEHLVARLPANDA